MDLTLIFVFLSIYVTGDGEIFESVATTALRL